MSARIYQRVAFVLLVGLCTPSARAQEGSERARAEASFRAGAAAYAAGEYKPAIQAFEAAYALTPLPAIAFSLAQAERRQYFVTREPQHLERALTLFRAYITQVTTGGRRADAVDALSQLEPLAATQNAHGDGPGEKPVAPPPTRLLVTCDAPGARIKLDDGEPAESPLIREVTPGKHVARVEAVGFFPAERELAALPGELILGEVTLRERPSVLLLNTPVDADVYIDGSFVAQGGPALKLELPAGSHRLAVAAKGTRVEYRSVLLVRGQTHSLRITLGRTALRTASHTLFGAGGAVLVAGIVLGGVAIEREGKAQDFLDRRERGNVSTYALAGYHKHVRERDQYRAWGIGSVGVGAALVLTGLLLRELDRPRLRDIQRDARSVVPSSTSQTPRAPSTLSFAPWLLRAGFGAALERSF